MIKTVEQALKAIGGSVILKGFVILACICSLAAHVALVALIVLAFEHDIGLGYMALFIYCQAWAAIFFHIYKARNDELRTRSETQSHQPRNSNR